MDNNVSNLLDWAEIETIEYSEHDNPHAVLGPRMTEEGMLIQAFIPTAKVVFVKLKKGKEYQMEMVSETGYYAVLVPEKKIVPYTFKVQFDNDDMKEYADPYAFEPVIDAVDMSKFENGIHYDIYEKLGAHPMTINGVSGVLFAVWAPNAIRVSVVGDFNLWDGRRHPMRRLDASGIFELFIPEVTVGQIYKYELKVRGNLPILKADPYANYSELRPATASIVCDLNNFNWTDKDWISKRKKENTKDKPMLVYEVHLGSWKKPEIDNLEESDSKPFYNYREMAHMLADYILDMGYTHIELMPIMEHPLDESWGYQVTGYFSSTARYGTPQDFMYFIDYMHKKGIGVLLDWVPAHFPRDTFGLSNFDGTCLYEHLDPRQGSHPHWGTLIFNYGRPQVSNFLICSALFWAEKYHVDGIRMDAVASMLYLDYGKKHGEWVANIYGGNENLQAIELLKHLNSVMKKRNQGVLLIAEESTAWEKVTTDVEDGGLGFDYKWNMGWMNDFTNYMKTDPLFRKGSHGGLTFSMIYAYSERFILVLSHDEVVHGKCSMLNKMPGDIDLKFANLRVAYGFMAAHPGKKLLFMGQEFAQLREWSEARALDWELLDNDLNKQMKHYVKSLNNLYKDNKALYELDYNTEGFEWINNISAEESILSFLRKTKNDEETLLVVCNFTPVIHADYKVGVPFRGKYKEIFNSDSVEFGGTGNVNSRLKQSKEVEVDERDNSISITVPPLGMTIFSCTPVEETKTTKSKEKTVKEKVIKEANQEPVVEVKVVKDEIINEEVVNEEKPTVIEAVAEKVVEKVKKVAKKATKEKETDKETSETKTSKASKTKSEKKEKVKESKEELETSPKTKKTKETKKTSKSKK